MQPPRAGAAVGAAEQVLQARDVLHAGRVSVEACKRVLVARDATSADGAAEQVLQARDVLHAGRVSVEAYRKRGLVARDAGSVGGAAGGVLLARRVSGLVGGGRLLR
jgi:hypothetical protein